LVRLERFEGDAALGCQIGGVGIVNGHTLRRTQIGLCRCGGGWRLTGLCRFLYRTQPLDQCGFRGSADHQRSA
jgi:hypothetical protein